MINRIGKIILQTVCQGFADQQLQRIPDRGIVVVVKASDQYPLSDSLFPQVGGHCLILKFLIKVHGFHQGKSRHPDDFILFFAVPDQNPQSSLPFEVSQDLADSLSSLQQTVGQFLNQFIPLKVNLFNPDTLCQNNALVLGLPKIKAVVVDIVLGYRVDEIGNIPV